MATPTSEAEPAAWVLDMSQFEALACALLEPCAKEEADFATVVRTRLKAYFGRWQAEAALSRYTEVCLRHQGKCSRYFVDDTGATLRLRRQANADVQ
jgi:hypothetical protein